MAHHHRVGGRGFLSPIPDHGLHKNPVLRQDGGSIAVFILFVFISLHYIRRVVIEPVEVLSDVMTHFIREDNLTRNDAPGTIAAGGEIGCMVEALIL